MRCSLTLAVFLALVSPAVAERLTPEACELLSAEQDKLGGARADMQRGPEWARINLPPDRLARIRRLIEVEEQIAFRCRGSHLAAPAEATTQPAAAPETEPPRKRRKPVKAKTETKAETNAEPVAEVAAPATNDAAPAAAEPAQKKPKSTKRPQPAGEAAAASGENPPKAPVKTQ